MGRETVYCDGCGQRLSEAEFEKGKAHTLGNRHYCVKCKPLPPGTRLPTRTPAGGTPSRRSTETRMPAAATPRRPGPAVPAPEPARAPLLWVGVGVGAAVLLLGIVLVLARNPAPRVSPPAPAPPAVDRAAAAIGELEKFLMTQPAPEAILARCEQARPDLRGSRYETRLDQIEARAREIKLQRETAQADKLDPFLADIKKIIREDAGFTRRNDVINMIEAALRIAGPRQAEVERLRDEYQKKLTDAEKPLEFVLLPAGARKIGPKLHASGDGADRHLTGFNGADNYAEWSIDLPRPATFKVEMTYACDFRNGGQFSFGAGAAQLQAHATPTGGWKAFKTVPIGTITIPQGFITVALKPTQVEGGLMHLKSLKLTQTR